MRGGIDTPFNSNRNEEVFWGETKATRGRAFGDRHASTPDSLARTTDEGNARLGRPLVIRTG
jgi:hypothetical protein